MYMGEVTEQNQATRQPQLCDRDPYDIFFSPLPWIYSSLAAANAVPTVYLKDRDKVQMPIYRIR